ncbi:hypothetical protein ACQ4LE_005050 [Meloidogyne hapla]|uniref:PseudoU_synth_2 domain-containing protein n=1 Tax=Meloidogyne hapla TaxID=6305 RepID=A0A1I8B6D1_MELHA
MADIDEDIFGLKQLDSLPLPNSFHHSQQQNVNRNTTRTKENGNLFEEHFFPELIKSPKENNTQQSEEKEDFFNEHFERPTSNQEPSTTDVFELIDQQTTGIRELWNLVDPVWKFTDDELVEFMAQRIVYETDEVIAFDKPFQVAYSGAPKDQAQLDRILQKLKKRVAPTIDRLHLISSLDKPCSGIIIFAKNSKKQQELKALLDQSHFYFRFRCLCKNVPAQVPDKTRISIPLIKVVKSGNIKFCPLLGTARGRHQIYHLNTDCKLLDFNKSAQVSLIDAFTRSGMVNLVRSHLYYGLDCPLVGDQKYTRPNNPKNETLNPIKAKINKTAMEALNLRKNDLRKLPMFMHLGEVHLPEIIKGSEEEKIEENYFEGNINKNINFNVIRAEMPAFFIYALKKLSLFK